jgi:hypothetical protein
MVTCTFFASIAFANNDTLNTKGIDNAGYYQTIYLHNYTRFKATVTITNADDHPILPKTSQHVLNPNEEYSMGNNRAFVKLEATFVDNGAASVTKVTNFYSEKGVMGGTFMLEEKALNEQQTIFECTVRTNRR